MTVTSTLRLVTNNMAVDLLDAPSTKQEIIQTHQIKLWNKITPNELTDASYLGDDRKNFDDAPFPVNDDINSKIALWVGDITTLSCHAIVNSTNETFSDKNAICSRVFARGGPMLRTYIREHVKNCRTGDAKITKGFDLPARYVIHTVGPKYNSKYHTAAESALFSCYSKVLQLAREHKIKSVGICPINSVRRGYPPHDGAHIALRVVRRFLENFGHDLDLIVFAVDSDEVGIYDLLMPLYFPRSHREQEYALYSLPCDIGGKNGEPIIPERQIRIADKPLAANGSDLDQTVDLSTGLDSSVVVGQSSFARMQSDVDRRWTRPKAASRKKSDPMAVEAQRRARYERLLRKAKQEDLTDIHNLRFCYVTGEDRWGRPVVVVVGKKLNFDTVDKEKALIYWISLLDQIVQNDYVVIYFHTQTTAANHPSMNYVRDVYNTLDHKYKKNLKALYIVHPSLWSRVVTWWFTTFQAVSMKPKVTFLGGVEYLNEVISLDQLQVPSQIMDYDFKVTIAILISY